MIHRLCTISCHEERNTEDRLVVEKLQEECFTKYKATAYILQKGMINSTS